MAKVAKEVSVALTGGVTKIPTTTEVTAVDTVLTGGTEYGYISEDGVEISNNSSTETISAWQNSAVVRTLSSENTASYSFSLLQNTKAVRELYYGATEDGATGKIEWKPGVRTRGKFVIDYIDSGYGDSGETLLGRHVILDGEVSEVEPITLSSGEAIGFGITITAYPDENGVTSHVFTKSVEVPETPEVPEEG